MSAVAVVAGTRRVVHGRAAVGAAILTILALLAMLAPVIAPHDPNAIDPSRVLAGPDASHPFGSDALGRDVLSRMLFAYRVSLGVAVGSVLVAMAVGIPLGLLAGFYGGAVDSLIMRPVDLLLALPALLLAMSLIAIIGPGTGVASWPSPSSTCRSWHGSSAAPCSRVAGEPYVAGARARGVSRRGLHGSPCPPRTRSARRSCRRPCSWGLRSRSRRRSRSSASGCSRRRPPWA